MITLAYPDKYIRKALYGLINGIIVDGETINVFDYRVTGNNLPKQYILLSTQTNQVNENVKCGDRWESSILLDIVTKYNSSGNTGSRLLSDDIVESVRELLENKLVLEGGLNVVTQKLGFPDDISSVTENESIFRKFVRVELLIN